MIGGKCFDLDCPNCKRENSLHVVCGMETDGDDQGVWYEFDYEIESQDCQCDIAGLDLMDEVRADAEATYKEL